MFLTSLTFKNLSILCEKCNKFERLSLNLVICQFKYCVLKYWKFVIPILSAQHRKLQLSTSHGSRERTSRNASKTPLAFRFMASLILKCTVEVRRSSGKPEGRTSPGKLKRTLTDGHMTKTAVLARIAKHCYCQALPLVSSSQWQVRKKKLTVTKIAESTSRNQVFNVRQTAYLWTNARLWVQLVLIRVLLLYSIRNINSPRIFAKRKYKEYLL